MRYIEAPGFTQFDMMRLQLIQYGALGNTWISGPRDGRAPSIDMLLDPIAAAACEAKNIGHHAEVGRSYFKERVYRTVRDGFVTDEQEAVEVRPCFMFAGDPDPAPPCYTNGRHTESTSKRLERENYVNDCPVFLRCSNYRPFAKIKDRWDAPFERAPQVFPLIIARLDDLKSSQQGLLYCQVIGPEGVAHDDRDEEFDDLTARNTFQRSLPFPFAPHIIIPMRDVRVSNELAGNSIFAQPALPSITEDEEIKDDE